MLCAILLVCKSPAAFLLGQHWRRLYDPWRARYSVRIYMGKPRSDPKEVLASSDRMMLSQRAKPDPMMLKKQADALREEVFAIEQALEENKMEALRKQQEKTDAWIEELLVQTNVTEDTQLLKSEGEVAQLMQDRRFSADNINLIFDRIVETSQRRQSIENCSPLISLLLDAACKVDCLEREKNPNKRWNHRVERDLRKKLFAMGWGINLEEVRDNDRIRSFTGDNDIT